MVYRIDSDSVCPFDKPVTRSPVQDDASLCDESADNSSETAINTALISHLGPVKIAGLAQGAPGNRRPYRDRITFIRRATFDLIGYPRTELTTNQLATSS